MHQHSPFGDFDAFEPGHEQGRHRWILLSLSLAAALVVGSLAGYALGRGVWAVPDFVRSHLPQFVAGWLPSSEPALSARSRLISKPMCSSL